MRIAVNIVFGDVNHQCQLPVGDGNKTFKWLGLAAAQRFSLRSPHGTMRMREGRGITSHDSSLIPNKISTTESVFYHPSAILKDHLSEGLVVTVELISRLPVDNLGVPQLGRWAYIAFNVSEEKQGAVKEMLRVQYEEIEQDRKRLQEDELQQRLEVARCVEVVLVSERCLYCCLLP
jgi:hypothetical protein